MISRRTMLTATLAGIPVGAAGGLVARRWGVSRPGIHLIGRRESMVALLDTGTTRVVFLLGEPDPGLLANLPQLLTVGRTRMDLVVGSYQWLTADGVRSLIDLHTITSISLQLDATLPPIRGEVIPVTQIQSLQVGGSATVTIDVSGGPDQADAGDPDVIVAIEMDSTTIMLASRGSAISPDSRRPALLALSGEIDVETLAGLEPPLLICTSVPADYSGAALLMHPKDPVHVAIKDGAVEHRGDQFSS